MKEIKVMGVIAVQDDLEFDYFWDAFIDFIESKGWSFNGGLMEDEMSVSDKSNS